MKKKITSHLIAGLLCLLPIVGMAQQDTLPDLLISNLEVTYDTKTDNILYSYQVTNIGNIPTNVDGISIQIAVSKNAILDNDDIFVQENTTIDKPLAPGETTRIPVEGANASSVSDLQPYLIARVDGENIVNESDEGNNDTWALIVGTQDSPPNLNPNIINNQLIVRYDNLTFFEYNLFIEILAHFDVDIIDKCNCNRNFALLSAEKKGALEAARDSLQKIDIFNDEGKRAKATTDSNEFIDLKLRCPLLGNDLAPTPLVNKAKREVIVYLIDSGLATEHLSAEDSLHLLLPSAPQTCGELSTPGFNYQYPPAITDKFEDNNRHGTFGFHAITKGVPDSIKVVPIKVFDKRGEGTLFAIICGIYHAIDNGADIINISAGYRGEKNDLLEAAIREADSLGIIIVAAAGNEGCNLDELDEDDTYYPAAFGADSLKNFISVASTNPRTGGFARRSNHGKSSITMTAPGQCVCGVDQKGRIINLSGTSMAAFYVTRQLAIDMALQNQGDTNRNNFVQTFKNKQDPNCYNDKTESGRCLKIKSDKKPINFKCIISDIENFINSIKPN